MRLHCRLYLYWKWHSVLMFLFWNLPCLKLMLPLPFWLLIAWLIITHLLLTSVSNFVLGIFLTCSIKFDTLQKHFWDFVFKNLYILSSVFLYFPFFYGPWIVLALGQEHVTELQIVREFHVTWTCPTNENTRILCRSS